ncbi:MAG: hypothetical protein M3345_05185 [Actinomycetota bacterium]|nr:hypothetical protein [Actinomycetota bacterium]
MRVGEPLRDPMVDSFEEATYRGRIGSRDMGGGTLSLEPLETDGEITGYRQRLSALIQGVSGYELDLTFQADGNIIRSERYRLETHHRDDIVAVEEGVFPGVSSLQWGGEIEEYPHDICPLLGCAVVLRGLDFELGARRSIAIWLANTVWWEVETKVESRKEIELPCGRFDTWRVRAWPNFRPIAGILHHLIERLLPPFYLDFERDPPHRFLRFEFPSGPFPWNPRALVEAVEITR